MNDSDQGPVSIGVLVTIADRVSGIDTLPRMFATQAEAMRDFKKNVNMPSDYMLFHTPGDFELVLIASVFRGANGHVGVSPYTERQVILTGTAAKDQAMTDRYIDLQKPRELNNASQQVGKHS